MVSITNASTPVSASFLGRCFDAAVKSPPNLSGYSNASLRGHAASIQGVEFGNGTCRIFVFTIRYEIQTRCASERFYIGNTDKNNLMSP